MKGKINAAANFQAEDFEPKNATDLDCLANPISASNEKLENSVKAKDKKNEAPFSSRRGSSHVLEFFSNENVEIHIQDKTPCAARSESGIAGIFYNAPICLDHFFQSDPIFKMNMLINTSTHI